MPEIALSEEQQNLVDFNLPGPLIIKGVAGSGKTLIGVKRVSRLLEQDKAGNERILVITYQRTLKSYLEYIIKKDRESGQQQISWDQDNRVDVYTIDQLIHREYLNYINNHPEYSGLPRNVENNVYYKYLDDAISEISPYYPDVDLFSDRWNRSFLVEEIKYINANRILTEKQYQIFDRKGRTRFSDSKFRLPKKSRVREAIYRLKTKYYNKLLDNLKMDFEEKRALALCQVKEYPPKQYTHLIIDESQDLDRTRIDFLKHFLSDERAASATFLYDVTQSIYPESWLGNGHPFNKLGIDIKGRSFILKKNYRSTYEIQDAALSMLKGNIDIDPELINRSGLLPEWGHFSTYQEQADYIINRIKTLSEYIDLKDIIIATRKNKNLNPISQLLTKNGIDNTIISKNNHDFGHNSIRLMTLHATKGLESEAVFLFNLNEGNIPKFNSNNIDIERKLLYVGLTRASKYLFLSSYGNNPSSFLKDISHDKLDILDPRNIHEFKPLVAGEEEKEQIRKLYLDLEKTINEFEIIPGTRYSNETDFKIALVNAINVYHKIETIKEKLEEYHNIITEDSSAYDLLLKIYNHAVRAYDLALGKIASINKNQTDFNDIHVEIQNRFDNFRKTSQRALATAVYRISKADPDEKDNLDWGPQISSFSKVVETEMKNILSQTIEYPQRFKFQELIEFFRNGRGDYRTIALELERINFRKNRNDAVHNRVIRFNKILRIKNSLLESDGILDRLNTLLA